MRKEISEIVRKACFEAWDRGFNAPKEHQDIAEGVSRNFVKGEKE